MAEKEQKAAVYVGWTTFKNEVMDGLSKSMPNVIDKSVFAGQAGGIQGQLMAGIKFLGLIDESGRPTKTMLGITDDDEETRKKVLAQVLKERYAPVFAIGIEKATTKQLADTMESTYSVNGDTLDKTIRFFVSAVKYAGIPISPLLAKGGGSGRRRASGARKGRTEVPAQTSNGTPPPPAPPASGLFTRSLALASGGVITISVSSNPLDMTPNERDLVFDLVDRLAKYGTSSAPPPPPSTPSLFDQVPPPPPPIK